MNPLENSQSFSQNPLLSVRNLSLSFPQKRSKKRIQAIDGVNLEIYEGEILGLAGESGCGKSSLSRAIMGLNKPEKGEILLENISLFSLSPKELRKKRHLFQMIFQDPYSSLNPRMTVGKTLEDALSKRKNPPSPKRGREEVLHLLEKVKLDSRSERKYPHEFSGGQRQRIAIARALSVEPKFLIADEAVSALDVSIQSQILNLLLDLRKSLGLTILFISHDLNVIRQISDRIAIMQAGKIKEIGEAKDVFENPQNPYTKTLLNAIPQIKYKTRLPL